MAMPKTSSIRDMVPKTSQSEVWVEAQVSEAKDRAKVRKPEDTHEDLDVWCENYDQGKCFDFPCRYIHKYEFCKNFLSTFDCPRDNECRYIHCSKAERILYYRAMSCKDFILFRACGRLRCTKVHEFLYCGDKSCTSNRCKRFHVTAEEIQLVRRNIRPFPENIMSEVDRIAYLYKNMYGEHSDRVCMRLLTGFNNCGPQCYTCRTVVERAVLPARCTYCGIFGGDRMFPECRHLIHESCILNLAVRERPVHSYMCQYCLKWQSEPNRIYYN